MLFSSFSMIEMKKRKLHAPIFLSNFKNPILKFKLEPIFEQIQKEIPNLTVELKWNQPMFIMNGTFIIVFSVSRLPRTTFPLLLKQSLWLSSQTISRQQTTKQPITSSK